MDSRPITKYLSRYAEPESRYIETFSKKPSYHNSVLIPVYCERTDFLEHLNTDLPNSTGKILIVLISNHPSEVSQVKRREAISAHKEMRLWLGDSAVWQAGNLSLFEQNNYDVLLVNRTDEYAIPLNQGVGLARKIGADLILSLIRSGSILSPWIMSTDADTLIPRNYFSINPTANTSGITYPFEHISQSSDNEKNFTKKRDIDAATKLYEKSINHYVAGLKFAGSEYAFSTLGSCLAIHAESYAQVRGFPKRAGGEDFYLLNKLAKVGDIENGEGLPLLKIKARESNRVPFGTGPAVTKLLASPNMEHETIFYHPEIFFQLKQVLEEIRKRPENLTAFKVSEKSMNALLHIGIQKALEHVRKQKLTGQQYDLHMRNWMDGFKTLKFVHYLRNMGDLPYYPNLTLDQLEEYKFF